MEDYKAELKAAGYTEDQIAREVAYMADVARENDLVRSDRAWNYGIHHASDF